MPSGTNNPQLIDTLDAWAKVVESMWVDKIIKLDVIDTHGLMNSFVNHVKKHSGGDVEKIQHMFRRYGIYQDMGVGRDTPAGNSGDLGKDKVRQAKPWYSKVFYAQVSELSEYMAYRYGTAVASHLAGMIADAYDQRYSDKSKGKTIGSLKTQMYRDKTRDRNMRNYNKRRSQDGRWVNEGKSWRTWENQR